MRRTGAQTWELAVSAGRYADGTPRRLYRSVHADTKREAVRQLDGFRAEVSEAHQAESRELRQLTMDEAVGRFLDEHLRQEKGREERTVADYWRLHVKWFAPAIGNRPVVMVDEATMDRLFGAMRAARISRSRLNHAKSLYAPFFRWAKRRGIVLRNPMAEFELPTSTQVVQRRIPPEIDQLGLLLGTAVEVVPDVAPVLALGAVTGMRRGELVGIRRSRIDWSGATITVDTAVSETRQLKGTKTRTERTFAVDGETLAMLEHHCQDMDERAAAVGSTIDPDPFLFSLALDCSAPMPPQYLTKRVAVLKGYLGIEDKRPATIALEDKALRLYRQAPATRPAGRPGPKPQGGLTYKEIGDRLGRTEWWASLAVRAAERREQARATAAPDFDGSVLALRKFTSSELLDAGFNVSMVAERQGHGPQVLTRHYAKSRRSADRLAAEHLGRVVHSTATAPAERDGQDPTTATA
ncbi:MAG: tyrosine-type recombinase/integrase [Acidimicrobiales bacterium]